MEKLMSAGAALIFEWDAERVRQACEKAAEVGTEGLSSDSEDLSRGGEGGKGKKDKHSGLASHISVRGSCKHPAQLRITEHRPNKT